MKKIFTIIGIIMLFTANLIAQDAGIVDGKDQIWVESKEDSSSVKMSDVLSRYLNLMDSIDAKSLKSTGYRIQVFSSSGPNAKKDALQSQSDFLKIYRDYPSYTKWNYPNWVVRLGDYRTHLEAMEFHNEVTAIFPASFIVKDEINVQ